MESENVLRARPPEVGPSSPCICVCTWPRIYLRFSQFYEALLPSGKRDDIVGDVKKDLAKVSRCDVALKGYYIFILYKEEIFKPGGSRSRGWQGGEGVSGDGSRPPSSSGRVRRIP